MLPRSTIDTAMIPGMSYILKKKLLLTADEPSGRRKEMHRFHLRVQRECFIAVSPITILFFVV